MGELSAAASRTLGGGAQGYGVVQNIEDAYRFLMNLYEQGDKVFLFGFSRGAFTAQAVAGLLNKCGLLYAYNGNLVAYALRIYLKKGNDRVAREFKRTMARACKPAMIGVWDTVKSLGDHHEDRFFYANPRDNCVHGYHAVSIDERREDFEPSLWGRRQGARHVEVWFPGVHSDVGGGYPEDGLANGALQWMIARAREHGVRFREQRVREFKPDHKGKLHDPLAGLPWSLRGAAPRKIPKDANVHASAFDRRRARSVDYAPANLPDEYTEISA